jgi:RNA polymerase sigma-70 factor (ECF subfamily)
VQDVLTALIRKLPEFRYDQGKSFRGWLRTVLLNRWRDRSPRRPVPVTLAQDGLLEDVPAPETTEFEDREYQTYLIDRSLQLLQAEFSHETWQAFSLYVLVGKPVGEVAAALRVSVNVVYLAKSRVLARLRQELVGLLD